MHLVPRCTGCTAAFFVWLLRVRVVDWLTGWLARLGVCVRSGCLRADGLSAVSGAACDEWGIGYGHGAARTDARGANLLGW